MATTDAEVEPVDHTELVEWVAVSSAQGSNRHLHRIDGDTDDIENGDEVEVACSTDLTSSRTNWKAKPASVFPPGYLDTCTDAGCFGASE